VRHLRLVGGQQVDLLVAMHRVPQAQARAQLQVTRLEHAFEQQDGATPAQGAHALGLGQVQQGKAIGRAQAFKHPLNAVPVGVGLDHGNDLALRGVAFHHGEVVAQGRCIDLGDSRFHLFSLTRA